MKQCPEQADPRELLPEEALRKSANTLAKIVSNLLLRMKNNSLKLRAGERRRMSSKKTSTKNLKLSLKSLLPVALTVDQDLNSLWMTMIFHLGEAKDKLLL